VQVVHIDDVLLFVSVESEDILNQLFGVKLFRSTLHQDLKAAFGNGNRGEHDDDCEEVGADWVTHPCLWPNVDDNCCDDHANGHNAVANYM